MKASNYVSCVAMMVLLTVASAVQAQTNLAAGKPVVDGSGAYPNNPYTTAPFPGSKVTDGFTNDREQLYWLGRELTANEWLVIDLGQDYDISRIDLQNTHNRQFRDRATQNVDLSYRTSAQGLISGADPTDWNPLASGTMTNTLGAPYAGTIPIDIFEFAPATARYIRIGARDFYYLGGAFGSVGLNEVFVYEQVQNVALHKNVVGGTGVYAGSAHPNAAFDINLNFSAGNVTDGSTSDSFGFNYWLGREGVTQENFTVDLGDFYDIDELRLRNTHNDPHNDRGTQDFEIWASKSVNAYGDPINPQLILASRLSNVTGQAPIAADVFNVSNGLNDGGNTFRYVQFRALTSTYGLNVGLNEFEVYGQKASTPAAASVTTFSGTGAGEGLDLQGNFVYAVNAFGPGGLQVSPDVTFQDEATSGVPIVAKNAILNWDIRPDYGASAEDDNLETVMHSIRWTESFAFDGVEAYGDGFVGFSAPVTAGEMYKLQLLFSENILVNRRSFDVTIEGIDVALNVVAFDLHGSLLGHSGADSGVVVTYTFTAGDASLDVLLSSGVGAVDANPTLAGFTLEQLRVIPEPATLAALSCLGGLLVRRRR